MEALVKPRPSEPGKAVQVQGSCRSAHYYDNPRREIAALVPTAPCRVLDVGCGQGQLGRLLRQLGHQVSGIELIPAVAQRAECHLDEVICGDVEMLDLPWPPASFDVVIAADVLEHVTDPWQVLRRLTELVVPGGLVIASIPNVQNYRVICNLIRGRWEYRERGLLDFGHLRFFTWQGISALLAQAGLSMVKRRALWNRTVWRRLLCWVTLGQCEVYFARNYLVVGQKPLAA